MPTPSPIMAPKKVVKSGILTTLLRMTIRPRPAPTPPRATAIGRPIARTEPKARINTMTAKARPMNSVFGGSNTAKACRRGHLEAVDDGASSAIASPRAADSVRPTSAARLTWA